MKPLIIEYFFYLPTQKMDIMNWKIGFKRELSKYLMFKYKRYIFKGSKFFTHNSNFYPYIRIYRLFQNKSDAKILNLFF